MWTLPTTIIMVGRVIAYDTWKTPGLDLLQSSIAWRANEMPQVDFSLWRCDKAQSVHSNTTVLYNVIRYQQRNRSLVAFIAPPNKLLIETFQISAVTSTELERERKRRRAAVCESKTYGTVHGFMAGVVDTKALQYCRIFLWSVCHASKRASKRPYSCCRHQHYD